MKCIKDKFKQIILTILGIGVAFAAGNKLAQPPIGGDIISEPQTCQTCEICKAQIACPIVEEKTCSIVQTPEVISTKKIDGITFICNEQLKFNKDTEIGTFNDAMYKPSTCTISNEKVLEAKQRIAGWVNIVKNPPPQIEPTKEELRNEKENIQNMILLNQQQLLDIDAKIQTMQ